MTWGCGGWRSATPPITFTWWRRWPARTAPGRRIWNDFYRVREACQDAERRLGLRSTAPADRTAARRADPRRDGAGGPARLGRAAPGDAAPRGVHRGGRGGHGAGVLRPAGQAGVLVRERYSTTNPGEVTGYAVGLPRHTARDGGVIWYGGGKLAADLTLPKLRARWAGPRAGHGPVRGTGLPAAAARAVLADHGHPAAEQAAG